MSSGHHAKGVSPRLLKTALVLGLVIGLGWVVGLVALLWWTIRAWLKVRRLRHALAPTKRCKNGHSNSNYGRMRCTTCGAVTDGWINGPCGICRSQAGWSACSTCGIAMHNAAGH
jgi:hypothetical protein